MMENMKPVCWCCPGEVRTLLPLARKVVVTLTQQPNSPPYPSAILFIHALNVFTMYRTAMSRLANKGIYKCVQICTHRISEKGGNRNYP